METTKTAEQTKTSTWTFDPAHSSISFIARHMLITNVKGSFGKFDGKVIVPGNKIDEAQAEVIIDINSIETATPDRDNHLKSADFFDAATYPQATFKSSRVEKTDEENYKIFGDLTIRNITRPIELNAIYGGQVKDPWGNDRMGFTLSGKLNRFEYELKWNALLETGGAVVGPEIKIFADISLVKQNA